MRPAPPNPDPTRRLSDRARCAGEPAGGGGDERPARPDLVILRHGETEWNVARRWQGALDSALTPRGEAQARALGAMLRRMGIGPETHRLVASPQGRARRTALLAFGTDPELNSRLREIEVGDWTGWDLDQIAAHPAYPREPDLLALYDSPPGGEGIEALAARCADFLGSLDHPAILVTHGMTGRMLRTLVLGLPLSDLPRLSCVQGTAVHLREGREAVLVPSIADGS